MHGIGIRDGLKIIQAGGIKPSKGIAGEGVYGWEVEMNKEGKCKDIELSKYFNQCATGGDTKEC